MGQWDLRSGATPAHPLQVPLAVVLTAWPGTPFNRALVPFKPLLWAAWSMVCLSVLASAFFLALFQRFSLASIK
jgi:hypothetical protein